MHCIERYKHFGGTSSRAKSQQKRVCISILFVRTTPSKLVSISFLKSARTYSLSWPFALRLLQCNLFRFLLFVDKFSPPELCLFCSLLLSFYFLLLLKCSRGILRPPAPITKTKALPPSLFFSPTPPLTSTFAIQQHHTARR